MDFQRVILGKMEAIGKEVDAGRVAQEKEVCPRVFFLVPADTSQWSTLERLERKSIFTKNMNLVFVCHTFFDEIQAKAKMQRATEEHLALTAADKFQDECSEIIDIKQPRDFFLQHLQVIKLSAQVIKAIGLATAFFGVSVQGVLPDNISDLDDLTEIMETGLEAAVEAAQADENEPIPGERAHTRQPGPRWKLKWGCGRASVTAAQNGTRQRMRDKCAHHVLQHYLEDHHVEWKSKVQRRLTPAHNSEYGYTYVCKGNEEHAKMWKERPAGCGSDTPAPSA
ncbi:unnamed protein product [Ectocarpus sp. 12 AP-2014]